LSIPFLGSPTFTFGGVWRRDQAKSEKFFIEEGLKMRDLSWQEQLFSEELRIGRGKKG
jgi:hypothetical protein